MILLIAFFIGTSIIIPSFEEKIYSILPSNLKFKVTVLNVFTKELKVDIKIHNQHKSVIVPAGHSHSKGITRVVFIDFKNIQGVHLGDNYEVTFSVPPHETRIVTTENITSLPIQQLQLDTNGFED